MFLCVLQKRTFEGWVAYDIYICHPTNTVSTERNVHEAHKRSHCIWLICALSRPHMWNKIKLEILVHVLMWLVHSCAVGGTWWIRLNDETTSALKFDNYTHQLSWISDPPFWHYVHCIAARVPRYDLHHVYKGQSISIITQPCPHQNFVWISSSSHQLMLIFLTSIFFPCNSKLLVENFVNFFSKLLFFCPL